MLAEHWQSMDVKTWAAASLGGCPSFSGPAIEPVTFSDPAWVCAILKHVKSGRLITVGEGDRLALALAAGESRWPVSHLQSWVTTLTPSGLPAVSTTAPQSAIAALVNRLGKPILLHELPADGPVMVYLLGGGFHTAILGRWHRAALRLEGTYQDWLQKNFDHKRRKEFKRLRARLGELGDLQSRELKRGEDAAPFIDTFLALEAAGWKGARGTAVGNDEAMTRGLLAAAAQFHAQGRLRFWQITLDGKAIATLFALVDGATAVLGKIAYDEIFARYSPGVLIILDATESLFREPELKLADSNAVPGHPMIDRLWRDRIAMADVLVASASFSPAKFRLLRLFLSTMRRLKRRFKSVRSQMTGAKTS